MKVLLVEDEKALADSISGYFKKEGWIFDSAETYFQAEEKIRLYEYDCILLDITLPGRSGLDLLKILKESNNRTGVIIISARNSIDDKVEGLDLGADDYLTKPFHIAELNSRLKSVVRRRNFNGSQDIVFNEIKVDPDSRMVAVNSQSLDLTQKEYDLLLFFLSNINRVVSKATIAEHLWGDGIDVVDSYDFIYSHIKNLRKKIMEKGGLDYIQNVYGLGYKFSEK